MDGCSDTLAIKNTLADKRITSNSAWPRRMRGGLSDAARCVLHRTSLFVGALLLVQLSLSFASLFLQITPANAAPPAQQKVISLSHTPANPTTLPPPGSKIKLTTFLNGSHRFEQPMRIIVNRDHKLLDIWLPTGRLNMHERPYYEAEIHAPEHHLSYRFLWYSPDGNAITSPEYTVERTCRYPLTQVPSDEAMYGSAGKGEAEETERLFHISEALSREITAYQEATRLLGELRNKFNALQRREESPAE